MQRCRERFPCSTDLRRVLVQKALTCRKFAGSVWILLCANGTITARKERAGNKRSGWYWKAYRTQHSKHSSLCLGKSGTLTLERLHAVAQALAQAPSEDTMGEDNTNITSLPTERVERPFA